MYYSFPVVIPEAFGIMRSGQRDQVAADGMGIQGEFVRLIDGRPAMNLPQSPRGKQATSTDTKNDVLRRERGYRLDLP